MNPQEVTEELEHPGARILLDSATLLRLAYNGSDGFPRVIPSFSSMRERRSRPALPMLVPSERLAGTAGDARIVGQRGRVGYPVGGSRRAWCASW
jgi:hypothetical protein